MPDIKVSSFREMSYYSHTRQVSLPHMIGDRLHMVICKMIQGVCALPPVRRQCSGARQPGCERSGLAFSPPFGVGLA